MVNNKPTKLIKKYLILVLIPTLVFASSFTGHIARNIGYAKATLGNTAKNIILFIGDGMELQSEIAGSRYLFGSDNGLVFHQFPYKNYAATWDVTTYNRYAWNLKKDKYDPSNFDPSVGYDVKKGGEKAFPDVTTGDSKYFLTPLMTYGSTDPKTAAIPATDSASAGTALVTGFKTDDGLISWVSGALDVGGNRRNDGTLKTIAEYYKEQGRAVGVVTTVPFSHATPASFVSHNKHRDNYYTGRRGFQGIGISDEIIHITKPDVVIGGGHHILNNPTWDTTRGFISKSLYDSLKVSSEYVLAERVAGVDGNTSLLKAADQALAKKKKLFGLFGGSGGNFDPLLAVHSPGKPEIKKTSVEDPTLAFATEAALKVLSKNPKGFFVMIEQGDLDWSNHRNNYEWMIGCVWDLNEAVKKAVEFVERPGDQVDWNNTLIIVTSDHANGYLRFTKKLGMGELPRQVDSTYPDGEVTYSVTVHTNELVTIYARGAALDTFKKYEGLWYPGTSIIDNTQVFRVMMEAAGIVTPEIPGWIYDATTFFTRTGELELPFKAYNWLTKGEFIKLALKLYPLEVPNSLVKVEELARKYDLILKEPFAPDDYITREEAVALILRVANRMILSKMMRLKDAEQILSVFKDAENINPTLLKSLAVAVREGILYGYPDKSIRPKAILSQSEAWAMFYRIRGPLTFLHFNDSHGRLEPFVPGTGLPAIGGFGRMLTLVNRERGVNPTQTMLFDLGDTLHGTNLVNLFKGKSAVETLNLLGMTGATLGNHDFNYGQATLKERILEANYPFLLSNVIYEDTRLTFGEPYRIIDVMGQKVGIFGLTTADLPVVTHPDNVKGLLVLDPIETARRMVSLLKEHKVNSIVALSHIGYSEDIKLAERVDGINLILGGHSHTILLTPVQVKNTLIAQAG